MTKTKRGVTITEIMANGNWQMANYKLLISNGRQMANYASITEGGVTAVTEGVNVLFPLSARAATRGNPYGRVPNLTRPPPR